MNNILITLSLILILNNAIHSQDDFYSLQNLIKKENLLNTVTLLTSNEFDGRLAGSEGYNRASEFMAGEFSKLGLKPLGSDSYFQHLTVEYNKIDTPVVFNLWQDGVVKQYELGKDFIFRGFSGSGNLKSKVVFCGYGISDSNSEYDDYKDVNVKGKIVIVFKQSPHWTIDNKGWSKTLPREKSIVAANHGAKGILFVSLPNDDKPQPLIGSILHGEGEQLLDFPQLQISIETADELLAGTGYALHEVQSKIDSLQKPFSFNLHSKVQVEVTAHYNKSARTQNVVGMIEGTDSLLRNEFIVIGGHLDHVGSQGNLVLFPGANDNASGSAGVLEIARAFVNGKIKTKRSVIFVLFASEEQGLFGSKFFVDNPPFPLKNITAMLNLDCVGYGDSIQVGNGKSSPNLWQIARGLDKDFTKMMIENTWNGGGADAAPFHEKGIPALYFVTKNSYAHLHLPTDKVETLNGDLYERTVNLAFLTAVKIANGYYKKETVLP